MSNSFESNLAQAVKAEVQAWRESKYIVLYDDVEHYYSIDNGANQDLYDALEAMVRDEFDEDEETTLDEMAEFLDGVTSNWSPLAWDDCAEDFDNTHPDTVEVMGYEYSEVEVLKAVDPIAYRECVNDWIDFLLRS